MMSESGVRLLHRGVPQPLDSRRVAVLLVIVMLLPIFSPVSADESVGRDDFGVLEAMTNALSEERDSGEDDLARNSAEGILSALEARGREIGDGDALLATDGVLGDISMRQTDPLEPSHPAPYVYLTDPDSHPDGWPNNLLDTLFELPPDFNDPLAFGANTYSLYAITLLEITAQNTKLGTTVLLLATYSLSETPVSSRMQSILMGTRNPMFLLDSQYWAWGHKARAGM